MALTKITSNLVAVNAIQGTLIADNAITAVHIVNNAITATQLADNAVTATKIQNGIIATDHLAADLITAAKIADDAISEEHLDVTVISSLTAVTANSSDYVMLGDASDSNNLKKALVSDLQQTDEEIADIVGAMVSSNTESGITVAYEDGDNTLDFTVGTLNQNTTGTAATVTTAAQPNITSTGTLTGLTVSSTVAVDVSSAAALILNSTADTPYMRFDHSDASKFTIGESSIVGGGSGYYDFYAVAGIGQRFFTGAAERMRIGPSGQIGIGGANYGSDGQVLTSAGSGATVAWESVGGGGKVLQVVTATGGAEEMGSGTMNSTGLYASITPAATSSKILAIAMSSGTYNNGTAGLKFGISRGTSGEGSGSVLWTGEIKGDGSPAKHFAASILVLDSPSSTASNTYTVMHASTNGSTLVGWVGLGADGSDVGTLVLMEIGA